MRILSSVLLACVVLGPLSARAADAVLPPEQAEPELPPVEPLPPDEGPAISSEGLYVRASGGWGFAGNLDASEHGRSFAHERIDGAAIALAGAGFKLNSFFRGDITIDHRFGADFSGRYTCPAPCGIGARQAFRDMASLSATTALVNGYLDLGPFGPVTPYVGAGIGASYLSVEDYRFRSVTTGERGRAGDRQDWNAAWALMAGIGFNVTDQIVVDVGYRFAALGDIRLPAPHDSGRRGSIQIDDITDQQVLVGLRYVFN